MALSLAPLLLGLGLAAAADTGAAGQAVPVPDAPPAQQAAPPVGAPEQPQPTAAAQPEATASRISELEARLAEVEGKLRGGDEDEADGPASVTGRGGVRVSPGQVVFDAVGLGGPVEVAGTVRGNAVGLGADVVVERGAVVDGHAVSLGGDVHVDPDATVVGEQLSLGVEEGAESALAVPLTQDLGRYARSMVRRLALLLVFAAAGTLAVTVWPRQVDEIAERVSDRPFWYGIAGAALTASLAAGAVFMSITVIGLPIALLFLSVLSLAWLVGMAAVCRTAGRRLAFARERGDTAAYLAGAALLALLAMVPAVGTVLALVIGFPAVGAAVVAGLSSEGHQRDW